MRVRAISWIALLLALAVSACTEPEVILEGQRLDIRAPLDADPEDGAAPIPPGGVPPENVSAPIRLPGQVVNAAWTHKAGGPQHRITHPALGAQPQLLWSSGIGEGNSRRHRITADPVTDGTRIFTLDSRATVTAFALSGAPIWRRDLTPRGDRPDDASGGGLAVADGRLYVTTAFGELVTLDASNGDTVWVQKLEAAATAAPTVSGGLVHLVSRDSRAWAVDVRNGRVRWQIPGAPSRAGIVGGPSPAISGDSVILPFSSGQVIAANRTDGAAVWSTSVAGQRVGPVFARILELQGDPVVAGDTIYLGNSSGRTVAIEAATGARIWTANEGATGPVWATGGSLFLVSDRNELLRLDAATGERIWGVDLPLDVPVRREQRLKDRFVHYGPILAGGRLLVASDDGLLRAFSPESGALISATELPAPAARAPIVAARTMYLVTADGQLHAFR